MGSEIDFLLSSYDYELPDSLIAKYPLKKRDTSKMMVLGRTGLVQSHHQFKELPLFLKVGDVLVMNETKVFNARIFVQRATGAKVEIFFLKSITDKKWQALTNCGSKLKVGEKLLFNGQEMLQIEQINADGTRILEWLLEESVFVFLGKYGEPPLPPYIKKVRQKEDKPITQDDTTDYQTVYANQYGAVAAPTAGLHFTQDIIDTLQSQGVHIVKIILHVGYGTFEPVKANDIREHHMHFESYELNKIAATTINQAKSSGHRVIAVGTTSARTLESCADTLGFVNPKRGETDIFIYPGYTFKVIDGMITNFHLPKSSLILFIAAFTNRKNLLHAYQEAIEKEYRFYSYGDCMLIL